MDGRRFPLVHNVEGVSCRVFGCLDLLEDSDHIDVNQLLDACVHPQAFLEEPTNSIPLGDWILLMDRLFAILDHDEERLKGLVIHLLDSASGIPILEKVSSPYEFYLLAVQFVGPRTFRGVEFRVDPEVEGIVNVSFEISADTPSARNAFILGKCALTYLPRLLDQPDSCIELVLLSDHRCELQITLGDWSDGSGLHDNSDATIQLQQRKLYKVQSQLTQTETLFQRMFEALPLLAIIHEKGRIRVVNDKAEEIIQGRERLIECVSAPDQRALSDFLGSEQSSTLQLRLETPQGQVEVLATNVSDPKNDLAGLSLFLALDITERLELQNRVATSERMASLGSLASGVAHEINNPMTSVIANVELALMHIESSGPGLRRKELQETLNDALSGATRVSSIVSEMNAFSRERDFSLRSVNVSQVLKSAIRLALPSFNHGVSLKEDLDVVPPAFAAGQQLGQVFVNLLNNAAFACDTGGEVTVRLYDSETHVHVEVEDTGSGMPEWQMARIFDPFFTTKTAEGTGLGLTISKSLLDEMKGSISVKSEVGVGSTFRVNVPKCTTLIGQALLKPRPQQPNPKITATGLKIFVIDDETILHRTLSRCLEPANEVIALDSGVEALELLKTEVPCVILCDLMLPGMTGIEIFMEIQEHYPHLADRVLFITGGSTSDEFERFVARHRDRTLLKPFTMKALNQKLLLFTSS